MRGSIYTDLRCPVCGGRLKSLEPRGFVCPQHPRAIHDGKCRVIFDNRTTRCANYREAYKILTRKRAEVDAGTYDVRDYMAKAQPLAFGRLAEEWLAIKAKQVRPGTLACLRQAINHASDAWGPMNIRAITYAQVEDFLAGLDLAPKTVKNVLDILKQFWAWVVDRHDIAPMRKWPAIGRVEMAFRKTVDLPTQEAILGALHEVAVENHRYRAWLAVKWLATYIKIRPGEMVALNEGDIDRQRGLIIVPAGTAKEGRVKIVPLLPADVELLRALPLCFKQDTPFFRHDDNANAKWRGRRFSKHTLWRDWKRACAKLGVQGVDLYAGTKHSTAMGLREVLSPEQVKKMTGHTTNRAFERYFHLEGSDLLNLYACRETLANPGKEPARKTAASGTGQIIDFTPQKW